MDFADRLDVSSLFTEVTLDIYIYITFDYIQEQIYTEHKLPPLSSKLLFKRYWTAWPKASFLLSMEIYKQIDGCGMGNPLSPVLANIFMSKLEMYIVRPLNPAFYDRYVDDCFSKRQKDAPDKFVEKLNNYQRILSSL